MGITYTGAATRTIRPQIAQVRAARLTLADVSFALTSCVAAAAIVLAYAGRVGVLAQSDQGRATVNLSAVERVDQLEPAIDTAFATVEDRSTAAQQLLRFVTEQRAQGKALPNVGAIARAHPLFTRAEIAALKPSLVVRTRAEFRGQVFLYGALYVFAFQMAALAWRLGGVRYDRLLLAAAHALTGVAFAVLVSRQDPLRDTLLFVRFAESVALGLAIMTACAWIDVERAGWAELSFVPLAGAACLSAALILFGSGPGTSTAKVNLGPFQPIEAIRLLLALFLAAYFARRWELLRDLRTRTVRDLRVPRWLNVPRLEYVLPVVAGVGLALLLFAVQKDLGPALFLCCVFLASYAIARGRAGMAIAGFGLLVLGFYAGYRLHLSSTVVDRVRMWQSPWDNAAAGGDQVTHALWGMATGQTFGAGLGLGDSRYVPAGHTDLILAAIGEELGAAGLLLVAMLFAMLTWRGFRAARLARHDYGFFLASILTLCFAVPALIMASGMLGVTPLTGIVTPFLSYGGSAMAANFAALGLLQAIHARGVRSQNAAPFRAPVRWVGGALAAFALVLIAVAIDVQVVRADEFVARPHLGAQADGGRRFEYNPRLLDLVRLVPRGTVYDRRGLPLASDDRSALSNARAAYTKLGIALADACPRADERCYPLGPRAFHLLGDARTRLNWTAPNTSYVDRDAEDALRGFDDGATAVHTSDTAGRSMLAIRRDYRELVPVLRHRYDRAYPAVAHLWNDSHDVHLTVDAGLQLAVSSIIASYATAAAGRAAAVVLDAGTGDVLASASYPWPAFAEASAGKPPSAEASADKRDSDALLDRARYGLYPPGSTFKLVTAAAALRQRADLDKTTFVCARLPDGRVGAAIKGWSRPVRDDVLDSEPHGTIAMHDGFVRSCNAYFAQLAVKLGPKALVEAAGRLGISLTPSSDPTARVRDTLPLVGYGQGDVVATPLRMARVAAVIADGGVLRQPHWLRDTRAEAAPDRFLEPDAARLLAGYMRDVVLTGTGRRLHDNPWRIAGKTGTAEVAGKPSHSWFVGFAPFGQATRRIAFAVIVENAGYGGASAAPAAGEIVNAAARAGLVQ